MKARMSVIGGWILVLVMLAGCGGTNPGHSISDLRGDAIKPVDKRPPEGSLSSPASGDKPFTLRRPPGTPMRQDSVVRVDPPPRAVTMRDTAASPPTRAVTTAPTPTPAKPSAATPPAASGQFLQQEPPQVIERVPAVAPAKAREERIGGTVLVKVLVGSDGLVRSTRIARSIPELDSAAVACVKQWKFKPAMSSGVAVAAWLDVPVRFLLQ